MTEHAFNTILFKVKAASLVGIGLCNVVLAWFQAAAVNEPYSILGIVNAILSLGLLGAALAVAYGYGGLNREVSIMHDANVERDRRFEEYVEKMTREGEEKRSIMWKEVNDLRERFAEQRGRESVLRELVDLPQKRV